MSDILLCTINAKWIHPSLALRLLKANLGELESRCSILEFALRQPLSEKIEGILTSSPRILGLSVSIWNHQATLELLKALSPHWEATGTRPVVILGGPEATNLPTDAPLLTACDWLIRGEGELAFRDLCQQILAEAPPGVEKWRRGTHQEPGTIDGGIVPLEKIQSGYRLYSDEDLSRKFTYVEASRGCPFGCEFCLSSLDRSVRAFPLEPFLHDLSLLIGRGARDFKFLDRSFNLDIDRAAAIISFFLERLEPGLCVHFEMVPSRFAPALRPLLSAFPEGSLRIEVGIQSFNQEVARRIGRASDPEKELDALEFLRDHTKAIVHADLIAGLPGENLASFAIGFDRLWEMRPGEIQLGILKRLPGTPIMRHDESFRMQYSPEPPYEVIETSHLSREELDRIKNMARFWELIVNREHFPGLIPFILPKGESAFARFLSLSDFLLDRFGKNWGIDRTVLRQATEEWLAGSQAKSPSR